MILHKRLKKVVALTALVTMTASSVSVMARDISGHWAEKAIEKWSEFNILEGYEDGTFRPKSAITRAELATVISKVFNMNYIDDQVKFSDVEDGKWYSECIYEVMSAGIMNAFGDEFKPNQNATRQEAAYAIAKAYHIQKNGTLSFLDSDKVADWAKDEVISLMAGGYITGRPDGSFAPNEALTRADLVVMMDKVTGHLIHTPSTYTEDVKGNLVINCKGVVLKNMEVQGNLYIAEGVGSGGVTLDNIKITGDIIVEGGENSIQLLNTMADSIFVEKTTGMVKIVLDEKSKVEQMNIHSAAQIEGDIEPIKVKAAEGIKFINIKHAPAVKNNAQPSIDQEIVSNRQVVNKTEIEKVQVKEHEVKEREAKFEGTKINSNKVRTDSDVNKPELKPEERLSEKPELKLEEPQEKPQHSSIRDEVLVTTGSAIELKAEVSATVDEESSKEAEHKSIEKEEVKESPSEKSKQDQPDNTFDIIDYLRTDKNDNITQYEKDGRTITSFWVKGIEPPKTGEGGDFLKVEDGDYEYYVTPYLANKGWYDINKLRLDNAPDDVLCSGAVAANMLHWWFEQNRGLIDDYVQVASHGVITSQQYGTRDVRTYIDSYISQEESKIFDLFKQDFGSTGMAIWADSTIDLFINGYRPRGEHVNIPQFYQEDNRGGFFYSIFEKEKLTDRCSVKKYNTLDSRIRQWLGEGRALGISHTTHTTMNHIITIWGADFDEKGKLIGLYVTDSDDQYAQPAVLGGDFIGMKRLDVRNVEGRSVLSSNRAHYNYGAKALELYSLSLGRR